MEFTEAQPTLPLPDFVDPAPTLPLDGPPPLLDGEGSDDEATLPMLDPFGGGSDTESAPFVLHRRGTPPPKRKRPSLSDMLDRPPSPIVWGHPPLDREKVREELKALKGLQARLRDQAARLRDQAQEIENKIAGLIEQLL